ncbi:MAG: sigma-70 family RNA polymerase sigma factor [Planctomycetota bacterium]|nr:sigma-70 family RNA polymerase sigma factor [Planctomycetota bacterium]MCB9901113.1 sigma-70 family RNA polymerase sigma factor [Planctomycetota bacterium]
MHGPPPSTSAWHDAVVRAHGDGLRRYAQRLLGCAAAADDAVQETFLRFVRTPPPDVGDHVVNWLYRCCRHRVVDTLRKEGRMHVLDESAASTLPTREALPDAQLGVADDAALAARLVRQLAPVDQELLHLRLVAGLPYAEIADVTGMSAGNVGYRLHHALRTLRTWMDAALAPTPIGRTVR